jgi:hypothetical protein
MRSLADRRLSEPYRSWIDRTAALPAGVRLIPRAVHVAQDLATFVLLGTMMGGMGALIVILPTRRLDVAHTGWTPLLILGTIAIVLWSVPVLLLRRVVRTLGAAADRRGGRLRQGVFIGPEGMLVRMEPGRGHVIPRERFLRARLFPPENVRHSGAPMFVIDTLDGSVEFFAHRLEGTPAEIHRAGRETWPSWKEPGPLMRKDRRKLLDVEGRGRLRRGALYFGGAMVVVLAAILLRLAAPDPEAADAASLVVMAGLLLLFVAVANVLTRFFLMKLRYVCPECRARATRVDEARPAVRFYCRACNVEWDTGMTENTDP